MLGVLVWPAAKKVVSNSLIMPLVSAVALAASGSPTMPPATRDWSVKTSCSPVTFRNKLGASA